MAPKKNSPARGEAAVQRGGEQHPLSTAGEKTQRQPERRVGKISAPIHFLRRPDSGGEAFAVDENDAVILTAHVPPDQRDKMRCHGLPMVTLEVVNGVAHVRLRNTPWNWQNCDKSFLLKGPTPGPKCHNYIEEIRERLECAANAEAERIERRKTARFTSDAEIDAAAAAIVADIKAKRDGGAL